MFKIVEFLVTGLYVGRSPIAPGTMGTLLAVPMAYMLAKSGLMLYLVVTVFLIPISIFLCQLYESNITGHDRAEIVIDEIIGYFVTFIWLPITWKSCLASFLIFRFFDILKPFPISYIDKQIKGGLGVVADDLAAGVIGNIILQYLSSRFHLMS